MRTCDRAFRLCHVRRECRGLESNAHDLEKRGLTLKRKFELEEAMVLGRDVGVDFATVDAEEFRLGLAVELEHGTHDPATNVTEDDLPMTAKIAWAHLKELPDYYTRLAKMEGAAE